MSLCDFSKNLSAELENLFANLGDSNIPEEAHRLDEQKVTNSAHETVDIRDILARMSQPESKA